MKFCRVLAGAVSASITIKSCYAFSASTTTSVVTTTGKTFSTLPCLADFDYNQNSRLPYLEEGYGTWKWRGHDINYLELGDPSNPPLLLIHGFGASVYHFRYNIPELAKDHHVYAFDLLGFGASSKPIQDYGPDLWRDQALDFIDQVIQRPAVVAGNSLGGFTALYAAASERGKSLVTACISLNGAGRFRETAAAAAAPVDSLEKDNSNNDNRQVDDKKNDFMANLVQSCKAAVERFIIGVSFVYTKQPARIEQVLRQVYPVNADSVDEELVRSIQVPSFHPNAPEVFYRVITKTASGSGVTVDDCLETLECPLLLCWGEQDPWIRPLAADRMQSIYPAAKRVSIDAGHCPHDENYEAVNDAIRNFVGECGLI